MDARLHRGEQALTGEVGTTSNGVDNSAGADREGDCVEKHRVRRQEQLAGESGALSRAVTARASMAASSCAVDTGCAGNQALSVIFMRTSLARVMKAPTRY
jgi:hypothetical protein